MHLNNDNTLAPRWGNLKQWNILERKGSPLIWTTVSASNFSHFLQSERLNDSPYGGQWPESRSTLILFSKTCPTVIWIIGRFPRPVFIRNHVVRRIHKVNLIVVRPIVGKGGICVAKYMKRLRLWCTINGGPIQIWFGFIIFKSMGRLVNNPLPVLLLMVNLSQYSSMRHLMPVARTSGLVILWEKGAKKVEVSISICTCEETAEFKKETYFVK